MSDQCADVGAMSVTSMITPILIGQYMEWNGMAATNHLRPSSMDSAPILAV